MLIIGKIRIREIDGISPPLAKLLHEQVPTLQGKKLLINVHNEMEALSIKRKYVEIISNIYEQFGFPPLVIETEISNLRIESRV